MKITLFDRTITGALLIRRFKEALPMVLYFVTYFIWFYVLEHVDRLHYTVIHTDIDDRIPFVEAFIIPYDMWFLYVALVILFVIVLKKDLLGIIWALLISFCVYDVLSFVMLFKMLKYRHNLVRNLGFPALSAALSGLMLLLIEKLLVDRIGEVLTVLIGAVIYFVLYMVILILLKGVSAEELEKIPFGRLFMGLSSVLQHDRFYEE